MATHYVNCVRCITYIKYYNMVFNHGNALDLNICRVIFVYSIKINIPIYIIIRIYL